MTVNIKLAVMLLGSAVLSGCSTPHNPKYQDMSELERPPQLEIVPVNAAENPQLAEENRASSRLGRAASFNDNQLTLALPFEQAWKLMDLVLKLNKLEISDKNHDKGQYFVEFDPDRANVRSNAEEGYFDGLFAANNYPKSKYVLTLTETGARSVAVKADLADTLESDHSSSDGYASFTATDSGTVKLLQRLYDTLHDELPLD